MEPGCGCSAGGWRTEDRAGPMPMQTTAMPPSRLALSLHVGSCTHFGAILSVRFDFDNSNQFQHPLPPSSPHSQNPNSKPLLGLGGFWTTHTQTLAAYHLSLQRSRIPTKFAARIAGKNSLKSPRCQFGSVALPSSLA